MSFACKDDGNNKGRKSIQLFPEQESESFSLQTTLRGGRSVAAVSMPIVLEELYSMFSTLWSARKVTVLLERKNNLEKRDQDLLLSGNLRAKIHPS
jgi:hypothetical protein